jgi:adenine-specific DNA-methyltransferase
LAYVDELIEQVTDSQLREQLRRAVGELRRRKKFGLVYEHHVPETALLPGVGIREGVTVWLRTDPDRGTTFTVRSVRNGVATIQANGESPIEVPVRDLITVRPLGEPAYPVLSVVEVLARGDAQQPYHAVINGENFHALQLLLFGLEGRVDLIYIDPPYNTGARDWKYNNNYVDKNDAWRHSKWLSFMEKRLRLARKLLAADGVLVVTVDQHEQAHLMVLLEDLFRTYERTCVTIVNNPRGQQGDNFSNTHEYAIFVIPEKGRIAERPLFNEERQANTSPLRNWGGESERKDAANCFYPILVKGDSIVGFGDVLPDHLHPSARNESLGDGVIAVWPIDANGIERKWRYARQSVESIRHLLVVGRIRTGARKGEIEIKISKETGQHKTVWFGPQYDSNTHGTQLLNAFVQARFDYPKSLYAVYECVRAAVLKKPNALIVDFFAGSGTTLHATCLLNAEDSGRRRCILVTNNEVSDREATALHAGGLYRGDPEFEAAGIFEAVTRPRIKAAITGHRSDGSPVEGRYIGGRPYASGFNENVAFLRLGYADPDALALGEVFEQIVPVLWLVSGGVGDPSVLSVGNGPWLMPDDSSFAVLWDEDRFRDFTTALAQRPNVTHVWLMTDSERAFASMREDLPGERKVGMIYRDYLRSFRVNLEVAR